MLQSILRVIVISIALGALPSAFGQHPFEQREPQAPLEHPVAVEVLITAQSEWTYHFGLNLINTSQRQTTDRQSDGPLETTRLIQNATIALRVVSVDEESGTATIEARFERLLVITGVNDRQSEFRWKPGSPKDPQSDREHLLLALAESTLVARVSHSGKVRGVVGFDGVNEFLKSNPDADRSALGLFAPSAIGSTLEMIWRPGAISGSGRNVQDEWTNVRRASLGQIGGVNVEQIIRVDRIEDGILKAKGEAALALQYPTDPPSSGAPQIELIHHDGNMKISWDLSRGCVASTSEKLDLGALWVLGPARLGVTMRIERSAALDVPPSGTRKP